MDGRLTVAVGVLSSTALLSFVSSLGMPDSWPKMVTGVCTLLGAGLSFFSRHNAYAKHEKTSEVAGQVIVAAAAFADALAVFASPAALRGDPIQAEGQAYGRHLREVADARYESIRPEIRTYGEARLLAEAYLPDAAVRHVRALWDLKTEMRLGWTRFSIGVGVPGTLAETGQQLILDAEKKLNPTVEALIAELRKHTVGVSDQGLAKS